MPINHNNDDEYNSAKNVNNHKHDIVLLCGNNRKECSYGKDERKPEGYIDVFHQSKFNPTFQNSQQKY